MDTPMLRRGAMTESSNESKKSLRLHIIAMSAWGILSGCDNGNIYCGFEGTEQIATLKDGLSVHVGNRSCGATTSGTVVYGIGGLNSTFSGRGRVQEDVFLWIGSDQNITIRVNGNIVIVEDLDMSDVILLRRYAVWNGQRVLVRYPEIEQGAGLDVQLRE